jgi:aldehyde dehydrogenase (NAD+)
MLINEQDEFLRALDIDVRKPRQEAYASEIAIALEDVRIARSNLHKWMAPESVKMPILAGVGASTKVIHEPLGVSLIVGAWNYPVMLTIGPLVGAIAAGCTAVLKPSELTLATSLAMQKAVAKYLDPEAYTVIQGGIPETTAVLEQRFDQIFFTGSPAVGKIVMAAAAKYLTPVVLELGGKSPAIVCEDAKLDSAVRRIAWGKFYNAGQTCIGVDYVLVHESKYEEFLTKTYETIEKMYGLDPHASPDFPQIVDQRNVSRIEALFAGEDVCVRRCGH